MTKPTRSLGGLLKRVPPEQRLSALGIEPELRRVALRMATTLRSEPTIRQLQDYLAVEETVEIMMEGRYDHVLGVLALTNRRILFVANSSATGPRLSVARSGLEVTAPKKSSVRIVGPDLDVLIDRALGRSGAMFAEAVVGGGATAPAVDPLVALAELRDRHAAGLIGDAEYETAKSTLLREL